jgi:hypothetical protein
MLDPEPGILVLSSCPSQTNSSRHAAVSQTPSTLLLTLQHERLLFNLNRLVGMGCQHIDLLLT